mmetsp:Transcript_1705/g.10514  ORF Transcript_1705/g.10514 Transcript_1705/m.10514 type:complete len:123 (+) Transcript_1705:2527-2895(+)
MKTPPRRGLVHVWMLHGRKQACSRFVEIQESRNHDRTRWAWMDSRVKTAQVPRHAPANVSPNQCRSDSTLPLATSAIGTNQYPRRMVLFPCPSTNNAGNLADNSNQDGGTALRDPNDNIPDK